MHRGDTAHTENKILFAILGNLLFDSVMKEGKREKETVR